MSTAPALHIKCPCYGCNTLVATARERCAFCVDCPDYNFHDKTIHGDEQAFTRLTITFRHYAQRLAANDNNQPIQHIDPANDTDDFEQEDSYRLWLHSIDDETRITLNGWQQQALTNALRFSRNCIVWEIKPTHIRIGCEGKQYVLQHEDARCDHYWIALATKQSWSYTEIERLIVVLWDVQVLDVSTDGVLVRWHGVLQTIPRIPPQESWWHKEALEHGWSTDQIDHITRVFNRYHNDHAWTVWAVTPNGLIHTTNGSSRSLVTPPKLRIEAPSYRLEGEDKPGWCVIHGLTRPDPYCSLCPDHIDRTDTVGVCYCEITLTSKDIEPLCGDCKDWQLWVHQKDCPLQGSYPLKRSRNTPTINNTAVAVTKQPTETKPVSQPKPKQTIKPNNQLGLLGDKS